MTDLFQKWCGDMTPLVSFLVTAEQDYCPVRQRPALQLVRLAVQSCQHILGAGARIRDLADDFPLRKDQDALLVFVWRLGDERG